MVKPFSISAIAVAAPILDAQTVRSVPKLFSAEYRLTILIVTLDPVSSLLTPQPWVHGTESALNLDIQNEDESEES